jgi:branched-chain amino acid transport system substrate-binding protein
MPARRRLSALFVVAILVLAACAPGTGNGEPEEGDIIIASAMPLTGPYASDGEEMRQALEMAIDDFNEAGGVLGRQLRLITCDVGALEVDTIQACGERLLGENPHAVITGYDDSGINTLAFGAGDMPYLHAVTMTAAVEPVRENPEQYSNVFQYDPSDYDYGVNAAELLPQIAQEIGFQATNQTVAVITTDYAYNVVGAEAFKEFIRQAGYDVVIDELTGFGVEEWGPVLSRIQQAEPAFVTFWNLDPSDAARFMLQWDRQFGDQGINSLLYMQYTPSIPEFMELTGDAANGLLWATVIGISDRIGLDKAEYTGRWQERFGREPQSIHAYVVRDAFEIWANAVTAAGCAACFDEVNTRIRDSVYEGFAGTYDFTPLEDGQYAQQGDEFLPTIWSQVQDARNVPVKPDGAAEGDMQMPPWIP